MSYKYRKRTPEEREKEVEELAKRLVQGTREYLQSDRYKEILDTFSRFHQYSFNNSILIMLQRPDASKVASYTSWRKDFNRTVKRGEKGIAILAPMPVKVRREEQKIDPLTKKPLCKADGTPETEVKEYQVNRGYKVEHTFDVKQTEPLQNGKNTPDLEIVHDLQGDVINYEELKKAVMSISPVPITFADFEGCARGFFSPTEEKIVVREGMSEMQSLKTMVHEVTHSVLHNMNKQQERNKQGLDDLTPMEKEIQAESTAYVVCSHYGIDTSDYSFPYISNWAGNEDRINANLKVIKETSGQLIDKIDKQLELQKNMNECSKHNLQRDSDELSTELSDFFKEYDRIWYEKYEQQYQGAVKDLMCQNIRHERTEGIQMKLKEIHEKTKSKKAESLFRMLSEYQQKHKDELREEKTISYKRSI